MKEKEVQSPISRRQEFIHEVIFEADTPLGKAFDVVLICLILMSVATVMLDSVERIQNQYGAIFYRLEWFFTIIFTIEYLLRLYCIGKPTRYATSFFGVVDLLAILPTYVSFFFPGTHYLLVIRLLRVLRVFRVLKIVQYVGEADQLMTAMRASRRKITLFIFAVFTLATIAGSLMYVIEGADSGFTSIPKSIYWSVVTLTTVGYGDISPQSAVGQAIATVIMLMGYGIIAVPTGIMTAEITRVSKDQTMAMRACQACGGELHARDAKFCKHCGEELV